MLSARNETFTTNILSTRLITEIEENLKHFSKRNYVSNTTGDNNDFDVEIVEGYYKEIIEQIMSKNNFLENEIKILRTAYDNCKQEAVSRAAQLTADLEEYEKFYEEQMKEEKICEARNIVSSDEYSDNDKPASKCGIRGCDGRGNTRFPSDLTRTQRVAKYCLLQKINLAKYCLICVNMNGRAEVNIKEKTDDASYNQIKCELERTVCERNKLINKIEELEHIHLRNMLSMIII